MTNYMKLMQQFEEAFGDRPLPTKPTIADRRTMLLRMTLIEEEFLELQEALLGDDIKQIAKEGADLLVVLYGTFKRYGIPMDKVFQQVHESNMSKLGEDGQVIRREDGKALKGPNYQPPNLDWLEEEVKV